ncbi:Voltage-dependent calcium channel type A subunit alpha-1, partial [Frankliniella fusca]
MEKCEVVPFSSQIVYAYDLLPTYLTSLSGTTVMSVGVVSPEMKVGIENRHDRTENNTRSFYHTKQQGLDLHHLRQEQQQLQQTSATRPSPAPRSTCSSARHPPPAGEQGQRPSPAPLSTCSSARHPPPAGEQGQRPSPAPRTRSTCSSARHPPPAGEQGQRLLSLQLGKGQQLNVLQLQGTKMATTSCHYCTRP